MVTQPYTEALERALGTILARANGELALIRERADATVATALARLAEAEANRLQIEARIAERLASLKDGKDGRDADPELVAEMVAAAVSAIPAPKDGRDGAAGKDGERGADGKDGSHGKDGAPGADGKDGAPGRDGKDGERGADGKDGSHGKDGAPGKLPIVRAWVDGVHYEGIAVSHLGSTYQALRDTGRAPPHEDWICIAAGGRNGADGRSPCIRGTWSESTKYSALDIVTLNGASFTARIDDPGPCPGEGWQLGASQGKRGNQGERGASGKDGPRGPAGAAAVDLSIDDQGLLTLKNGDGSEVRCDLYPVLSKLQQ